MGNRSRMSVLALVFFLFIASFAVCETATSSKEMEQYLHNPTEYNSYKDKFMRSFPDKPCKDPRAHSYEEMDEPIRRSIESGTRFDKKDKKITSLPERYVREERTYRLSQNRKMETASEVRRQADGSSSWSASIRWTSKEE